MNQFSLKWTIEDDKQVDSIKEFMNKEGISRRALTDIKFSGGLISVNGIEQTVKYQLQKGDVLEVIFPKEERSSHVKPEEIKLVIMYEDRDIIVVDKPPYMNSIPSREHPTGSLANALIHHYDQSGIHAAVHIVTRLDRNTSGLVLIAKHRHAHHLLSLMQREHAIKRIYEALVEGTWNNICGIIDRPIGRKRDSIIEREVREDGQRAVTYYEVLQQFANYSHILLRLETGRTHQIRVHMSYMGHPLLGDDLYGGGIDRMNRQALHCKELHFTHPFLKKEMSFAAPLPVDMKEFI